MLFNFNNKNIYYAHMLIFHLIYITYWIMIWNLGLIRKPNSYFFLFIYYEARFEIIIITKSDLDFDLFLFITLFILTHHKLMISPSMSTTNILTNSINIIEHKRKIINTLWIYSKQHQHEQKLAFRKLSNQIKKLFEQHIDNNK